MMRPTAKKHINQDMEVSMDVESVLTTLTRSKSKTKFVIQRVLRTLRMLVVIAAVNLPIYMMLLFKDWID